MKSDVIKNINTANTSAWLGNVFITLDIDWAHDEVLWDAIELLEGAGVKATWFITHQTALLEKMRANRKFELGVHPNFNFLLNGDNRLGKNAKEVVERLLHIVPEAVSVRSHSLTQNSNLLAMFKTLGLTHDCNHLIAEQTGIILKPWLLWNGLVRVPFFWEDDLACIEKTNTPINGLLKRKGLKVFNFHPIHIFLNTESMERYERTRDIHQNPIELIKHRYEGEGTRTRFLKLLHNCGTAGNQTD